MNISDFKSLVDAKIDRLSSAKVDFSEAELKQQILNCIPFTQRYEALLIVRQLETDFALRWLCDAEPVQLYADVIRALKAVRLDEGCSPSNQIDWERVVELGLKYAKVFDYDDPLDQRWSSNSRLSQFSYAIRRLRELGYRIELPQSGEIVIPDSDRNRIKSEVSRLAKELGRSLAFSIVDCIGKTYSGVTGRYHVGRTGKTVELNAKPEMPLAYLYHLGLRYFSCEPAPSVGIDELDLLIELATCALTLEDIGISLLELQFARIQDLPDLTKKSALYDAAFTLTQAKPIDAEAYIFWLLKHPKLAQLNNKKTGRTAVQVLALAKLLLQIIKHRVFHDFIGIESILDPMRLAFATGLDVNSARSFLREVFAHEHGANQKLSFPPRDTNIDAAFRPLLVAQDKLFLQPGPIAARAVINASLDWCRKQWPTKMFDDEVVGPLFEEFVRDIFTKKGIEIFYGQYEIDGEDGECDAVLETKDVIIFFELKSKMLTRKARSGDDITALADLGQAIVRPQAQAMRHHAFLTEYGSLTLRCGKVQHVINKLDREVFKISITRGDLHSLHDRPYLQHLLRTGCGVTFETKDVSRQNELAQLHNYFDRFKAAAVRAGEMDFTKPFPFSNSWSLSVFHLMLLLERSNNAEDFAKELQRNRRVFTPLRDFYQEYAFMLDLEASRDNLVTTPQ
ncbi:hypothetical protein HQN60_01305 [Deefgea piscis]|uniref:Uncharacterized protein n=1 Tax=Deefgea piscis TaxID=2739061 RepID=A0A6M8SLE1_9NEIS|nr:hypothetical protein [Deefgea piscis]QKJ65481.1 hypothetical protein HQN60_01305 [Deefgea piscis]